MNPETTTVANWVAGLVATGIVGTLVYLLKRAVDDMAAAVKGLEAKVDVMSATIAKSDGDLRELKAEFRAEMKAVLQRVDRVERVQAEIV